ncbi:radical SAM protein [Streptosporangium sp. NPDC002721]|uniref:radical SAM protein n=1 Tax=Streptosporangium sp. NPDC002721 TaxID=3366188 RepID=UPI0036904E51
MSSLKGPGAVIWDVTYACPLRCTHCYSESGRRPSRQLSHQEMLQVADAIVTLGPKSVEFAGGEPLMVRGIFDVAERIKRAGIATNLYTGGWTFTPQATREVTRVFSRITVSVDGADAEVHDAIRGRTGSFERAMRALALLDEVAPPQGVRFGVDCVVTRGNFHQMEEFCTTLAPRFANMAFLNFGAVVPSGLASRPGFEGELLTEPQLHTLAGIECVTRLRSLAPPSVQVMTTDNFLLQMNPDMTTHHGFPMMQVEPDGQVRAMPIYEGTVGSLLNEDPLTLWRRAISRWRDPFVVETLSSVHSMREWAEATRRLDLHFGSEEVRRRIALRPAYPAPAPA